MQVLQHVWTIIKRKIASRSKLPCCDPAGKTPTNFKGQPIVSALLLSYKVTNWLAYSFIVVDVHHTNQLLVDLKLLNNKSISTHREEEPNHDPELQWACIKEKSLPLHTEAPFVSGRAGSATGAALHPPKHLIQNLLSKNKLQSFQSMWQQYVTECLKYHLFTDIVLWYHSKQYNLSLAYTNMHPGDGNNQKETPINLCW